MNVNWKNSACIAFCLIAIASILFDFITMRIEFASGGIGLVDFLLEWVIDILLLSIVVEVFLSCIKKLKEGESR